jgi:hypothetical protein
MDVKEGEIVTILNIPDWNKYKYKFPKPKSLNTQIKAKFVNEWYKDTEDVTIFSKDAWKKIRDKERYNIVKIGESIITVKDKNKY